MLAVTGSKHGCYFIFVLQWKPDLTICRGSVKIISLNRDIVTVGFLVKRYCEKISKNIVIPG